MTSAVFFVAFAGASVWRMWQITKAFRDADKELKDKR